MKKIIKNDDMTVNLHDKVKAMPKGRTTTIMSDTGGVVNRKTLAATEKADGIIQEAEAAAERLRHDAAKILGEVEGVREQARQEGLALGRQEGFAEASEFAVKLETIKEKFYANAEGDIIALVMEIAEKVIGKMVLEHRDAILAIIRQAIESSLGDRLTIRLNPDDYKAIHEHTNELRELVDRSKRLVFKEDDSISQGGCVVETEVGVIDAQLETQLRAIRKALEL